MNQLFAAFLFWTPSLVGLGSLPVKRYYKNIFAHAGLPVLTLSGLCGLILLCAVGLFLNFIIPLSPVVGLLIGIVGWSLFLCNLKFISQHTGTILRRISPFLFFYLTLQTLNSNSIYDTGLYHIQTIRWAQEHSLVLGLANLHGRLGFNSIWFLGAALFQIPKTDLNFVFAINMVLTFFFGLACISAGESLLKKTITLSNIFLVLSAYILFSRIVYVPISSPSTDLPIDLFAILITYLLLRANENKQYSSQTSCLALALSGFAVSVKLSAIPMLVGATILSVQHSRKPSQIHAKKVGFLICIMLGIWMLRGVGTSGCLAYPAKQSCVPRQLLSWSVDPAAAQSESEWVTSWGRAPYKDKIVVLSDSSWVDPWFKNFWSKRDSKVLVLLFAIGVLLQLIFKSKNVLSVLPVLLFSVSNILFWFTTAPNLRFGWGYLISFSILIFSLGICSIRLLGMRRMVLISLGSIIISGLLFRSVVIGSQNSFERRNVWPKIEHPKFYTKKISSGQAVYLPQGTDQCWDLPLPCTPYFNSNLIRGAIGAFESFQ